MKKRQRQGLVQPSNQKSYDVVKKFDPKFTLTDNSLVLIGEAKGAGALRALVVGPVTAMVCLAVLVGYPHATVADEGVTNACGCHQTDVGECLCERKSKCGYPGECEPKGCEERRAKLLETEIQAETKTAEEADRKRKETNAPM